MTNRKLISLLLCALPLAGCDDGSTSITAPPPPATTNASSIAARMEENNPSKKLFRAILYRDARLAGEVIRQNPEAVNKYIKGTYPIIEACEKGQLEIVKLLVEANADLKVKDREGWSVVWLAVSSDNIPTVEYFAGKGIDLKAREVDGETLLFGATTREMAQMLIKAGIDPKAVDRFKDTALHTAARYVRKDVAEVLIKAGADVNARGKWNMTPLHSCIATKVGDPLSLGTLLIMNGADVNAKGFDGQTPLHEAALVNRYEMAQMLLNRGAEVSPKDDAGRTPMDTATLAGKRDRIRLMNLLVKHGAPGQIETVPR